MHKRKIDIDGASGDIRTSGDLRPGIGFPFADVELSVTTDRSQLEAEWRGLERLDRNSLHQGYDWSSAWFAAHRTESVIVKGTLHDRTVLLIPLDVTRTAGIRIARPPGGRFNNVNTALFSEDFPFLDRRESEMAKVKLREALAGYADLLILDNIPLNWHGRKHPFSAFASIENPNRSYQLPLRPSFEETIAQLNARTRKRRFRIQTRRLEALGGYEHICPADSAGQHALLDLFFRQKSRRLMASGLPDIFSSFETRDFFHRLLDMRSESDDTPLTMHALRLHGEHEGHVAAIAGLSRKGGHVLCQFSSIDETVAADASPGELLFWLMIEQACREGASVFDFGLGDQPYKRSWCTQETVQHDLLMPLNWIGMSAYPVAFALSGARSTIKRHPALYSLTQRLRARLDRGSNQAA